MRLVVGVFVLLIFPSYSNYSAVLPTAASKIREQPNILLIVADDLGLNDIGHFGSEIHTPNIDSLARDGIVFTNFYASITCSPTRSMLLSGIDNHLAGLGTMGEVLTEDYAGLPGYEGYLNYRVASAAEIFQQAGYHTYMTGKWHLGLSLETSPYARGFDKSFVLLQGGAGAFSNMLPAFGPGKAKYREDKDIVTELPENFYSTRFYTERMISYIDQNMSYNRPFFAYLAFTAPHWPLQAPRESIEKYRGKYKQGYDKLREYRLNRLKELGWVKTSVKPYPLLHDHRPWSELTDTERRYEERLMETYAAMVDDMDVYIGKLIRYLKIIGEYENTAIFFPFR